MLTDEELLALLTDLESDRVERKASATDTEKIAEAVCAFANDMPGHGKPGVIFIGLRDDGTCAGLPITDELLRKLADIRSSGNIVPIPRMTVQKRVLSGCELAVVIVEPADAPPVRYKGHVCIRVGPRRAYAGAQEERILTERRRSRDLPWDARPFLSAGIEDLDLLFFEREYLPAAVSPEVLEQNQHSVEEQLAAVRMASPPPDVHPTAAGLLICGKSPQSWIPGSYVQFVRYEGTEQTDPIVDQKRLDGTIPDILRRLDEVLEANIHVRTEILGSPREVATPDYPLAALQQIARNALMHRDYEGSYAPVRVNWFVDRVEIHSPGGPYGQVSPENFGQPGATDYRNPHIAEALRNLGYVQKFGVGIALARRAMRENGNPEIEFQVTQRHVLAVLRRRA